MTFKQLKDLLNNINDENILKYDLEIDVFMLVKDGNQ